MNVTERESLVRLLSSGQRCTVADLAEAADLEPAAVDLAMMSLRELGLEVEEIVGDGGGYRLAAPIDLLDTGEIRARFRNGVSARVESVEVESVLTSTSDYLAALPAIAPGKARVCFAEYQTRGRGRLKRQWLAPFGSGVCLSVDWSFAERPQQLGALSLAVGVAAVSALAGLGADPLSLKWPNDILCGGNKLGGILIDGQGGEAGPFRVIVGIGVNHRLNQAALAQIAALGSPATDLTTGCAGDPPLRNDVAAALVNELVDLLSRFEAEGFGPWAHRWGTLDVLRAQPVRVDLADGPVTGIADGIDETGALRVRTDDGVRTVIAGEVTVSGVRAASD